MFEKLTYKQNIKQYRLTSKEKWMLLVVLLALIASTIK